MSSAISQAIIGAAPMGNLGSSLSGAESIAGINPNLIKGLSLVGGLSGDKNKTAAAKKAYQAYQNYLNGVISQMGQALEDRADKYDNKLQSQFSEAEPQYQQEANTQLPELTQLVNDIAQQSAEAQRQNRVQTQTELAQQGIRGGQAAVLANRATGELNRDLQRDINQTVYGEAANRQNSRLNYYGQKALTPWSTMSNSYGSSMTGASNALSGAQGQTYASAYNNAMDNYVKQAQTKKNRLGGFVSGALSGAAQGGALGGAPGAIAGGVIGGVTGAL